MCRSNQVNEIAEEKSSSEEECNLIHSFDSCDEFEIMAVETKLQVSLGKDEKLLAAGKHELLSSLTRDVRKIDIRRNPKSHKIKSLKALVSLTFDQNVPKCNLCRIRIFSSEPSGLVIFKD